MSDRLTMLVMVGIRTGAHTLRSHVGIGSGSDCLLGQLRRILDISDSDAGVKEEKLEGSVGGKGEIAQIMFENWVSVTYWLVTVNVLTSDYVENAAICPPFAC